MSIIILRPSPPFTLIPTAVNTPLFEVSPDRMRGRFRFSAFTEPKLLARTRFPWFLGFLQIKTRDGLVQAPTFLSYFCAFGLVWIFYFNLKGLSIFSQSRMERALLWPQSWLAPLTLLWKPWALRLLEGCLTVVDRSLLEWSVQL